MLDGPVQDEHARARAAQGGHDGARRAAGADHRGSKPGGTAPPNNARRGARKPSPSVLVPLQDRFPRPGERVAGARPRRTSSSARTSAAQHRLLVRDGHRESLDPQ